MSTDLETEKSNRLIVLLPSTMVFDTGLAHLIHWEASRQGCEVYYLTLKTAEIDPLSLSRAMTTMKAVTADNHLVVHWVDAGASDWTSELKALYHPGNKVICLQGHMVRNSPSRVPISDYLRDRLGITAQVIPGFAEDIEKRRIKGIPEMIKLAGFLVITGLFTWFQYRADLALDGFYQNLVILFSLVVELGILWYWSNFRES